MVRVRGLLGALLWLPLLAGCVSVAEFRQLETEVRGMQRKDNRSGREQIASVSTQIEDLSDQIKKLQGRVEVVENQTQRALQEARSARKDASVRSPASGPGESPPLASAEPPLGVPPPPHQPQPPQPPTATTTVPPAPAEAPRTASVPKPAEPARPPAVEPAPAGPGDDKAAGADEVQSYRNAYAAWRSGDTEACIDQFRKFLQTHPASPYADDAAYWMADCYFKRGEYRTAILRFDDVVKRYPKGNKAADALYRQGEALMKSGPAYSKAARQAFEQVVSDYPDSPRAGEAKKQIEQLGGPAAAVAAPRR